MKIVRTCLLVLGLLGCTVAAQAQRTPVPVMNFENIPVSLSTDKRLSTEQVKRAFVAAGVVAGWDIVAKSDGLLEATFRKGDKHTVVVTIRYDATSYSIRYVSSVNLKYADSMPQGYERSGSYAGKTLASTAAETQDKLFAGRPEEPYERPDPKAVIHPFYERWLHELLDNVRGQLKVTPGATP
jgi:hypothetical protein